MEKPIKTIWAAKMEAGVLDIYLYDNIVPDGVNFETGETIQSATSAATVQKMIQDAGDVSAINVYINSYGGDVKEGDGIYSQLKRAKAVKTAYIDGFACSIASVIPMACDKVVISVNGAMMIHAASTIAWGNEDDLRNAADMLHTLTEAAGKSYSEKAGEKLDPKLLASWLDPKNKEQWLTAEQCLQYGLVDEIAEQRQTTRQIVTQRFAEAQAASIAMMAAQHIPQPPEQFKDQETNAERLMAAFRKNLT